ncbi:DUF4239 domain-containing protein [Candidatus Parabeggiatoa sp. HSG14]|nr:DUF4239 domain-containing protein [Thiotrichales bacterium HSG14]
MKISHSIIIIVLLIFGLNYLLITPLWHIEDSILEIFFSIFSIIYAIVAGFVIMVLLENYNAINAYIWAEINALQDLRDYLVYVDNQDEVVDKIKRTVKIYAESVIEKEWPEMVSSSKVDMDTSAEIYEVMKSINKIEITNQSDTVALSKLIDTVGNITTHRTNRLYSSYEKLPFLLMLFIIISSFLVVFIFTLLPIQDTIIRFLLNWVNIFAVVFIYIIIWDLSHPFNGTWSISNEPYRDFLTKM